MKVSSMEEAWNVVNMIFPTDYEKDEHSSLNAGYPIYKSTADEVGHWISDLGTSLEVNFEDGRTIRINVESESVFQVKTFIPNFRAIVARIEQVSLSMWQESRVLKVEVCEDLGGSPEVNAIVINEYKESHKLHFFKFDLVDSDRLEFVSVRNI